MAGLSVAGPDSRSKTWRNGPMLAFGMILAIGMAGSAEDPSGLVHRLGSPRYAERVQASEALANLGREALPALREARESRDAEVRSQATALVETIENRLLVEATEVVLDFDDRPLVEVVQTLSKRSGMRLHLYPENPATWKDRRIHLVADGPVPFWTAITELCRAGGLSYDFASGPFGIGREPGTGLRLMPGVQTDGPTSDSGPFRATLTSIHHSRERSLKPGRVAAGRPLMKGEVRIGMPAQGLEISGADSFQEDFHVQMQIVAEPRLTMSVEGSPRVLEAIDDRGQSLTIDARNEPQKRYAGYSFGYVTPAEASMMQLPLPLRYPAEPGKTIRRLRVGLALEVAARRPDPIVLPIAEANGQTIRNGELSVEVHGTKPHANGGRTLDVTIRSLNEPTPNPEPGMPPPMPRYNGPDSYRNPLEIVDDQDRPVAWYAASMQGGPDGMHLSIQFLAHDQADPTRKASLPAKIRLYEMNRVHTELTLDFQDIPMPLP